MSYSVYCSAPVFQPHICIETKHWLLRQYDAKQKVQTMLSNISWATYISTVLLMLVVYYIVIGAKFYSREIKGLLTGRTKLFFRSTSGVIRSQEDEEGDNSDQAVQAEAFAPSVKIIPSSNETDDTLERVRELTGSIREVIAEAAEKNFIKEEFFLSLQRLLKKYSFLKGSPSLAAINNLIASECEKWGYIQLSAEERVMLWNE